MPQQNGAKKRRRTFFARIPSTFTKNNSLSSVCSITEDNGKLLHSKSTYFYRWGSSGKKLSSKVTFLIPSACGLALLVGGVVAVNPAADSEKAYATITSGGTGGTESTDTTPSVSLALGSYDLTNNSTISEINYISTPMTVTAKNVENYHVAVQASTGNGNLVGQTTGHELTGVGSKIAPANFSNNTWGYGVAEGNIAEANLNTLTYSTLPASDAGTGAPAYTQKTDNEAASGKAFTLAFAAKFGDDAYADHYKANVLISVAATAKQVATYSVTYDANSGTGTAPAAQTADSAEDTYEFTVAGQGSLTKSGYTFLGWSESSSATTATYTAGSKITLAKASPTKTLYAIWEKVSVFGGITTMQEMTSSICQAAAENDTKRLKDTRDGKYYWVAKLKDGNCWMTQNLDYDGGTAQSLSDWVARENGYYDPGLFVDTTPTTSRDCGTVTDLANCTGWTRIDPNTMSASDDPNFNPSGNRVISGNTYDAHYLVGNYYGGLMDNQYCPTNWYKPRNSDAAGSFIDLFAKYGITTSVSNGTYDIRTAPFYFVYGGEASSGIYKAGSYTTYWTSSSVQTYVVGPMGGSRNNVLDIDGENVNSTATGISGYGNHVRCVFLAS